MHDICQRPLALSVIERQLFAQPAAHDQRLDHVVAERKTIGSLAVALPLSEGTCSGRCSLAPPLCGCLASDLAQPLLALLVRHCRSADHDAREAFVTEREHVRTPRPDLGAVAVSCKAQAS